MSRQGLVKKQVQVTKDGKTFTQTVWVRPDGSDPSGSSSSTLDDLFKTNKLAALNKLKEMGIKWEENAHPAINLMRAKMALKKHNADNADQPGNDPQSKSAPAAPQDTKKDNATDGTGSLLGEFDSIYKKDKNKALEFLKQKGVKWEENAHPAINVMRAKMALKKFAPSDPQPQSNEIEPPKKPEVSKPEEEKPKVETVDVKALMSKPSKDRKEFDSKIEKLSRSLTDEQAFKINNLGIMGTDPQAVKYLTEFLEPKYQKAVEGLVYQAKELTESDPEFWIEKLFGKTLPKGVRDIILKTAKITDEKAFNTLASPKFSTKAFLAPRKLVNVDAYITDQDGKPQRIKDVKPYDYYYSIGTVSSQRETRAHWNHKLSSLRYSIENANFAKDKTDALMKNLDSLESALESVNYNPYVIEMFSNKFNVQYATSYEELLPELENYVVTDGNREAYERGEMVSCRRSQYSKAVTVFSKSTVNSITEAYDLVKDQANIKALEKSIKDVLNEKDLAATLRLSTEWEHAVAGANWATKQDVDLSTMSPILLRGVDYQTVSSTATPEEKLKSTLRGVLANLDLGVSTLKLKPSLKKTLDTHLDDLENSADSIRTFLNSGISDLQIEDSTKVVRPKTLNCNSIVSTVSGAEYDEIVKNLSKDFDTKHGIKSYKVKGVYRVDEMPNMDEHFNKVKQERGNVRTLYHGTGSFATGAIVGKSGEFKIVKAKVGRMLGNGIYLADKTSKSMLYVSDAGYSKKGVQGTMMVCEAVLGKTTDNPYSNWSSSDTIEAIHGKGRWSNLVNSEWCVRDPKAVRPRYLVHVEV